MPEQPATPIVGIVGGSRSDFPTLEAAVAVLDELGVPSELKVVSAHRTPDRLFRYAEDAAGRGIKVIIAGAGGAAHLPGMAASMTPLPVFGVPMNTHALEGKDSLLSIMQMPPGVPVGTLAIGKAGAINAALLAASVLALSDAALATRLEAWRKAQTDAVAEHPSDEGKACPHSVPDRSGPPPPSVFSAGGSSHGCSHSRRRLWVCAATSIRRRRIRARSM